MPHHVEMVADGSREYGIRELQDVRLAGGRRDDRERTGSIRGGRRRSRGDASTLWSNARRREAWIRERGVQHRFSWTGDAAAPVLRYRDRFDSVAEAERLARRRLPRVMFARLNGGADDSVTAQANVDAFARGPVPAVCRGAARSHDPDDRRGAKYRPPPGAPLDPLAARPLRKHPEGAEPSALAAAARAGTICAISPAAGHGLSDIDVPPGAALWGDQVTTASVAARGGRAADGREEWRCGFHAAIVTVDPVLRPKAAPIRIRPRTVVEFGA